MAAPATSPAYVVTSSPQREASATQPFHVVTAPFSAAMNAAASADTCATPSTPPPYPPPLRQADAVAWSLPVYHQPVTVAQRLFGLLDRCELMLENYVPWPPALCTRPASVWQSTSIIGVASCGVATVAEKWPEIPPLWFGA